jgi:hypothetical protein
MKEANIVLAKKENLPAPGTTGNGSRVLRVILNTNLGNGHDGLKKIAAKVAGIGIEKLQAGEYLVFINSARDKMKVYASGNIIAYLRLPRGQILNLATIQEIPRVFRGDGQIDYPAALKSALLQAFEGKRKR